MLEDNELWESLEPGWANPRKAATAASLQKSDDLLQHKCMVIFQPQERLFSMDLAPSFESIVESDDDNFLPKVSIRHLPLDLYLIYTIYTQLTPLSGVCHTMRVCLLIAAGRMVDGSATR